ncbi:MAG: argininosuccinate lyase, partial [Dehalococcoidales bacterium]|nr:argininosuccinate lyase [Dehalococcoidales bacterium]
LVKKGETFRSAHGIVGKLVSFAVAKDKTLAELSLAEYKKFSPLFSKDVLNITVESSLASRNVPGGTAPAQVRKALARAKRMLTDK